MSGETLSAVDDVTVVQVRLIPTMASVSTSGFQDFNRFVESCDWNDVGLELLDSQFRCADRGHGWRTMTGFLYGDRKGRYSRYA